MVLCSLLIVALLFPASLVRSLQLTQGDAETEKDGRISSSDLAVQLVYMSGDVSSNNKVYDDYINSIGWYRHKRLKVYPRELGGVEGGVDNARLYVRDCKSTDGRSIAVNGTDLYGYGAMAQAPLKGLEGRRCSHCAFVFSYTDDDQDQINDYDRAEVDFCGMKGVHRGFAREANGYIQNPRMPFMLGQLTDANCENVVFAGHSLGGSVASLMAFCANNHHKRPARDNVFSFMAGKNVKLITFGAPSVSKHPLYNTNVGEPFNGQRYVIGHKRLPPISMEFGTESINMVAQVLSKIKDKSHSEKLFKKHEQLKSLMAAGNEAKWRKEMEAVYPKYGLLEVRVIDLVRRASREPGSNMWGKIENFLSEYKGDLSFEYDPIPAMNLGAGFMHPMMTYQQLVHPKGTSLFHPPAREDIPYQQSDVWEPARSSFRTMFGILGAQRYENQYLPNHQLCCYVMAIAPEGHEDCHKRFYTDMTCASQDPATYR